VERVDPNALERLEVKPLHLSIRPDPATSCWILRRTPNDMLAMPIPPSIAALPGRATALTDQLVRWCDQNSGSENAAGLAAMLKLLRADFGQLPGVIEEVPLSGAPASALRVRVRPRAPRQIFLSGHFDTVYGAADPFQECERLPPDKLRGPAVIDMKGGLVVMLAALQAFEATPAARDLGYEVLLNPDEETGSFGSAPWLTAAARQYELGLVFEPARPDGALVHSRKGTGNFTVTARGRAAHAASARRDGRNAIAALAEFLTAAGRLPEEMPGVLFNIGNIRGGGPATNVVPDFAEAQLDLRVTKLAERDAVLARLEASAAPINAREGFGLKLTGSFNRPPMELSPKAEAAFASWQQCGRELGLAPFSWVHAGGGSDANILAAAGLPCLDGLGPVGDRLHSPDEWVHLPSLVERAEIAALYLHRLAAGEISL
jgi:glutamate carboxypeptidase